MKLYLIRHGETTANYEKKYLGHADSPLTPLGQKQAAELAERLLHHGLEAIFVSDLPRAMATAWPLLERTGLVAQVDPRLRELDFGAIAGLTYTQAMQTYGQAMQAWYDDSERNAPPRGETLASLRARVFEFIDDLVEQPYETVAIFTHGGVCNLLLAHACGQPFDAAWSHPGEVIALCLTGTSDNWCLQKL